MQKTMEDTLFLEMMRFIRSSRRYMLGRPGDHGEAGERPEGGPCRRGDPGDSGHGCHHHHHHPVLSRERILTVLADHEEGLRQKQLSEKLHVNASSISEFTGLLEEDGYVVRKTDPSDRRAALISLTAEGMERARELQEERSRKLRDLFGNLTEEEKKDLLRLIRKLGAGPGPGEQVQSDVNAKP